MPESEQGAVRQGKEKSPPANYFRELGGRDLLAKEEEVRLAKRVEEGGQTRQKEAGPGQLKVGCRRFRHCQALPQLRSPLSGFDLGGKLGPA